MNALVLDVGGVGYQLSISGSTFGELPAVGAECRVYAHLSVRENELSLYGFATTEEKSLFLNLIRVSGIGPSTAMQILGQSSRERLVQAIVNGDMTYLTSLKGLGKKTSERIVVELRDRLQGMLSSPDSAAPVSGQYPDDALRALLVLGLSADSARQRLSRVAASGGQRPARTEDWIRLALKSGAG